MAGVNKAILIGNLGKDPELKYLPSGQAVANFSLATTERRTDKNGQRQDRTEWHNIVVYGKTAEVVNQYLKKGRSAYIEGRITTRSWDDRDGNKKYRTEIVANTVQFLGSPGGSGPQEAVSAPEMVADSSGDIDPAPAAGPAAGASDDLPF
jgi:single-strand DNA-binding protein